MGGLVEVISSVLSRAERRVEVSAQNVANATTPGYKKQLAFFHLVQDGMNSTGEQIAESQATDFAPGKLISTGKPLDVAISGPGFFTVNVDGQPAYTRQGQFHRGADGRLETAQGYPVQGQGGGDLKLKMDAVKILQDGTILDGPDVVDKIALVDVADKQALTPGPAGTMVAPKNAIAVIGEPQLQQGMLEASNVSLTDEMIAIMSALPQAQTGQRLMNAYDDLMGRVVTALGQA
jgi:flagellar basal-body rod protein FlgF